MSLDAPPRIPAPRSPEPPDSRRAHAGTVPVGRGQCDPTGLRVAVVAETFLPAVTGVVNAVLRVVDHLAVRGHDPVVVAPSGARYEARCGAPVEVHTVPAMRLPRYRELSLAQPFRQLTPPARVPCSGRGPSRLADAPGQRGGPRRPGTGNPDGRRVPDRPGRPCPALPTAGRGAGCVALPACAS